MKKVVLYRAIPSLFTISAFVFGLSAINLAVMGDIKYAILYVFIACVLDLFDGRVARMLKVDSKFGAELDSLSDLVCFGIATFFIVIFFEDGGIKYNSFLYLACFFYAIATMLRLARFNLKIDYPSYYDDYFIGVPTPAAFILAVFPISLFYGFNITISSNMYAIYMVIIALLMVSSVPTPSLKNLKIKINHTLFPLILLVVSFVAILLIMYPWFVLSFFSVVYIIMILVSVVIVSRKKSEFNSNNNL